MCYLHFGNGVRTSGRKEADYCNGVCTYIPWGKLSYIPQKDTRIPLWRCPNKINKPNSNFSFFADKHMWPFVKKYPKAPKSIHLLKIQRLIYKLLESWYVFSKKPGISLQKLFQPIVIEWYCLKLGKKVVSLWRDVENFQMRHEINSCGIVLCAWHWSWP